jgi:uncharacterized protein
LLAHPVNALSFLIASTNLVIELGIVLWVLLGWKFFVGNFMLGTLMIIYAYILTRFWFFKELANNARQKAQQRQEGERMHQNGQMKFNDDNSQSQQQKQQHSQEQTANHLNQ